MYISIIQSPLYWESPEVNRRYFAEKIRSVIPETQLVVLPEMFTTGFTMNPEAVAETMEGDTVTWMKTLAVECNLAITGSVVIRENEQFFNRLLFVFPTGEVRGYDKRHLFSLAGENKKYTKGTDKILVEYLGWKICPLICYDLRFPVFSRYNDDYDLLLYVANWPKPRISAWDTLLKARAIENMSFVIGVNRTGEDSNNNLYPGHSQVLDCFGNYVVSPMLEEGVVNFQLNKTSLEESRTKFGFLHDKDSFTLTE